MPDSAPLETPDREFSEEEENYLDYCASIEALEEFQISGEIRSFEDFVKDLGL